MPEKLEYRYAELRRDPGADRTVSGVVVRYGDTADIGGAFRETFKPGSLAIRDATLNVQHRREMIVAREGAGLTFQDSSSELRLSATLPKTRIAEDALEAIDAGLLRGLSMEFLIREETWADGKPPMRTVSAATLRGVAIVDTPAFPQSKLAEARALAESFNPPTPERRWMI